MDRRTVIMLVMVIRRRAGPRTNMGLAEGERDSDDGAVGSVMCVCEGKGERLAC